MFNDTLWRLTLFYLSAPYNIVLYITMLKYCFCLFHKTVSATVNGRPRSRLSLSGIPLLEMEQASSSPDEFRFRRVPVSQKKKSKKERKMPANSKWDESAARSSGRPTSGTESRPPRVRGGIAANAVRITRDATSLHA